jgi:hypothetical protein
VTEIGIRDPSDRQKGAKRARDRAAKIGREDRSQEPEDPDPARESSGLKPMSQRWLAMASGRAGREIHKRMLSQSRSLVGLLGISARRPLSSDRDIVDRTNGHGEGAAKTDLPIDRDFFGH